MLSVLSVRPAVLMAAAVTSYRLQLDLFGQDGQICNGETETEKKKERIDKRRINDPRGGREEEAGSSSCPRSSPQQQGGRPRPAPVRQTSLLMPNTSKDVGAFG